MNSSTSARRRRVLYISVEFPQASQTYIFSEIAALYPDADIKVIAIQKAPWPAATDTPYIQTDSYREALSFARDFKPDVLHGHWMYTVRALHALSRKLDIPYTVRGHSFDVMYNGSRHNLLKDAAKRARAYFMLREYGRPGMPAAMAKYLKQDNCLGVLTFPFTRRLFTNAGVPEDKVIGCRPVVDVSKFYDEAPNGEDVMNVGACIAKKRMTDFIDLANLVPERAFNLYPIGYETPIIKAYNAEHGSPVIMHPIKTHDEMPAEYKKHGWLVYTAAHRPDGDAVGWPLAVAEAQASGCVVCMPNIRADIADYIGDAGILYDDIRELPEIIRAGPPRELRAKGFEQSKKSDINVHKQLLLDLWDRAV